MSGDRAKTRCSCPQVQWFDGKPHPVVLDPDCREHSFPQDEWRVGHPLRRHALGDETPREVTARLLSESEAISHAG